MSIFTEIAMSIGATFRQLYNTTIEHPPESTILREAIDRNRNAQLENAAAASNTSRALAELLERIDKGDR